MHLMMDPDTKKDGAKSLYCPKVHTSSQSVQLQSDALASYVPTDSLCARSLGYTLESSAPENAENKYTNTNDTGDPLVLSSDVVQRCENSDQSLGIDKAPEQILKENVEDKEKLIENLKKVVTDYVDDVVCEEYNYDELLWDSIKNEFNSEKNIENIGNGKNRDNIGMLISKMLVLNSEEYDLDKNADSFYEDYVENNKILDRVQTVFGQLRKPIEQTLNDIYFWVAQDNGIRVISIELTSSDIHTRGVGVCVVEYEKPRWGGLLCGLFNIRKKVVIKPDDKSFEKVVLGKRDSLADKFNELLINKLLRNKVIGAGIGTLNIQTSTNNAHGSAVEYFAHEQRAKMNRGRNIDTDSVESHIVFASLLGLSDLHSENVVYSPQEGTNAKSRMQYIDAEAGLSYLLSVSSTDTDSQNQLSKPPALKMAMLPQYGGMLNGNGEEDFDSVKESDINEEHFKIYNADKMKNFLREMGGKLEHLTARIVVIKTSTLLSCRNGYLREEDEGWTNYYRSELEMAKCSYEKKGFTIDSMKFDEDIGWAKEDFMEGKLPFYRLDFDSGEIYHDYPDRSGPRKVLMRLKIGHHENFLKGIIADRRAALGIAESSPS